MEGVTEEGERTSSEHDKNHLGTLKAALIPYI
jgi:hypothetical protein